MDRKHWRNATPIRQVFKAAFESAGLPYFRPHSLRRTLAHLGETRCQTPEQFKAWSQNLGHEDVLTTFMSYGTVGRQRQGEIIKGLSDPDVLPRMDADAFAEAVAKRLRAATVGGIG